MKSLFFLLLSFALPLHGLLTNVSMAQGENLVKIEGTVTDHLENKLPGITVMVVGTNKGAATNEHGFFSIEVPSPGDYVLQFSGVGYQTQQLSVNTSTLGAAGLQVKLDESTTIVNEVEISGAKQATLKAREPFAINSIDAQTLQLRTMDVNQMLNQTTGIRIREDGGLGSKFNFSLNGLSGKQIKFFIDGVPMDYLGDAFSLNNVPVNQIERVEVYKGVVPIHLGSDALGGAVNIITRQQASNFLDASYSFGSLNTHRASVSGKYRSDSSGLTVNFGGFYNYSDNDYRMEDMPVFINGKEASVDIRRFHDNYRSALGQLEIGVTGKRWADELMAGVSYAEILRDVQSGVYGTPVGEAVADETNAVFSLRYKKSNFLTAGLKLNLFSQYSGLESVSTDTSSNRYNWRGEVIRTDNNNLGELVREKSIFEFTQASFLQRVYLSYDLNPVHRLSFNYVISEVAREGKNRLDASDDQPFVSPNTLQKQVAGLAYEVNLLDDKLTTVFSGKYYHFDILAKNAQRFAQGEVEIQDIRTKQQNFGYSFATRFFFTPRFYSRFSLEKGYRIPEPREIFGDGLRILANPNLKPENSLNLNLGLNYEVLSSKNRFQFESNVFYRDVEEFVYIQQAGVFSIYTNLLNVLAKGVEFDFRYNRDSQWFVNTNLTWQQVLNNARYVRGTQMKSSVYRDQMPNTPYLFANAEINYRPGLIADKVDIGAYYTFNYVQEFYLNYPRTSIEETKNDIPAQFLHHIGVSFSDATNRHAINFELRNIFDAAAYDNFKMQKPGRAFNIKYRYFINDPL